jgi:predicted phage terminase large subunit-like protein
VVTPWHVDDPVGRLKKKMLEDPKFPQFEIVNFPAEGKEYASGWLFPERFPQAWYETQKQVLGQYGYNSLMQCDPQVRSGNLIRIDKVHIVGDDGQCSCGQQHDWPKSLLLKRAWDLASSKKETNKSDPDFTSGPRGGMVELPSAILGITIPVLYVDDWVRGQWEATRRQNVIRDVALADGSIEVGIEAFAAYKDAYTELDELLRGIRVVTPMRMPGDKKAKASPLIPVFEAGNVYFKRAPWNSEVLKTLADFDGGAHDDDVDALAVLFEMLHSQGLPGMVAV